LDGGNFMKNTTFTLALISAISAVAIWFLVVTTTMVVTFFLPEMYASTTRILVSPGFQTAPEQADATFLNTQLALIRSDAVLKEVIEELDLRTAWGPRYLPEGKLHTQEVIGLLNGNVEVRLVRGTRLISISVFGQDKLENAQIAASMVEAYQRLAVTHWPGLEVTIVEPAVPALRPIRPNKLRNITLGMLFGGLAGLAVGGALFLVLWQVEKRKRLTVVSG
jgi:uncharacterized protein involved in exopolysaccharide biosynthesis